MSTNFLLASLLGCHDTWKESGQKGLAVFVIPNIKSSNGYYWLSRYTTDWSRGQHTPIVDTRDMVNKLTQISNSQNAKIDFLSITAHGTTKGSLFGLSSRSVFKIGYDSVTVQVLTNPTDPVTMELKRLQSVLAPDAVVELRACVVGGDLDLIREFSNALGGVRVIASADIQWGTYPGLSGDKYTIRVCEMGHCNSVAGYDGSRTCGP